MPQDELLNGIYLTPDYGFAVAMASRPENSTTYIDDKEHKITFEKPELFKPEEDIFIYTFDSENIPEENLKSVDKLQYVVLGMNRLVPIETEATNARKVLKYYELANWRETGRLSGEISDELKFR